MDSNELTGLVAAFLAAICFGSYGVPMKGEAATRVNVDPLVFQSYKAFTVLTTSAILIAVNNFLAHLENAQHIEPSIKRYETWTFSDFTPWAFVSASLWVPGGTAGVYAIRRAGLAISVGIWSCVIVILSFIWGVLIFHEEQRSGIWGALKALAILCVGLCGIAYFSSFEAESKKKDKEEKEEIEAQERTPLLEMLTQLTEADEDTVSLDLKTYPHSGQPPHCRQSIIIDEPDFLFKDGKHHTINIEAYNIGILMAVVNGVLAATIMVPLHYAPSNATQGIGFSMSFGVAAVLIVIAAWILRWFLKSWLFLMKGTYQGDAMSKKKVVIDSLCNGYNSLPSFHVNEMWKPGLSSGLLYSLGNLMGIVSIQRLGNFMGYSLNQSSLIVSGLWGIFYYREIAGATHMVGFLVSVCIVFAGILLLGYEHVE